MYHEIKSIIRHRGELTEVVIQCGISRGIPMIKMYGSISREYSRYRELLPYTFAQVGRKLPQRKIHINYSSDRSSIGSRDLDLPTALSINSAINAYEQRNIYAVGELSMDGKISPSDDTGAVLYILQNLLGESKVLVYGAKQIISAKTLFPKVEYIQTPTLLQCIRDLEGDVGELGACSQIDNVNSQSSPIDHREDLPHFLSTYFGLNCVVINGDDRSALPIRSGISMVERTSSYSLELQRLMHALGSHLEAFYYDGAIIQGIDGLTRLQNLLELSGKSNADCAIHLDLTPNDVKDQRVQDQVIKLLGNRTGVILHVPICMCGNSRNCSCSTSERLRYKTFINGLYEAIGIVLQRSDLDSIFAPSHEVEVGQKRYAEDHKGQRSFIEYIAEVGDISEEMKATLKKVSRTSLENIELF